MAKRKPAGPTMFGQLSQPVAKIARIARRLPGPRVIREPLAVSLAAQLGVLPILLVVFGDVPLVTPVTNLLAAPAAEAPGVYGLVASAVAGVCAPLGPLVQQPTALLVGWITTVARASCMGLIGPTQTSARTAPVSG